MEQLAEVVAHERLLLEQVVFKLVQLRQMLVAGDGRFLAWTSDELEQALDAFRDAELARALLVTELAAAYGIADDEATLQRLIDVAPQPWQTILADHRAAMSAMVEEMQRLVADDRRLAEAGHRSVTDALDRANGLVPAAATVAGRGPSRWDVGEPGVRFQRSL